MFFYLTYLPFFLDILDKPYELCYYKKSNIEWGTPLNCENIINTVKKTKNEVFNLFPNPTRDNITIASNLNVSATLYNAMGQPVLQQPNATQIDMSKFEGGVYNLILTHNDLQFTKKIIKQ